MKPVIGFVGTGAMGAPMAQNILKAGYPLVVYDLKDKAMEGLAKAGAEKVFSPRELASRSSVVITMLPAYCGRISVHYRDSPDTSSRPLPVKES